MKKINYAKNLAKSMADYGEMIRVLGLL